ncbi:MAG: S8 family serine peptidase [Myxococcota bacterium]
MAKRVCTFIVVALLASTQLLSAHAQNPGAFAPPDFGPPTRVVAQLRGGLLPADLGQQGISVARVEGRALRYGRWTVLHGDAEAIAALDAHPDVLAVRRFAPQGLPPLNRSAERLGLPDARGAAGAVEGWTGRGVTIADLDTHVDVFHPDFFRGDAGYFDWVDVDEDGRFSIGVDGIDLDGDGAIADEEIARLLTASLLSRIATPSETLRPRGFAPSIDWVYLDANGDRTRNFGAEEGFTDATPAFGEPVFVPDDVNGNGLLDASERLIRLGSSKFRAVYTRVDSPNAPFVERVYRNGVDLSQSPADVTGGVFGFADTEHATAVLGILAGGLALPNRRHVGIAPDAELINASEVGSDQRLVWALMEEPDIVLHEYVNWAGVELDGTDTTSMLIDESSDLGILHVCPAGNIGGRGKHIRFEVEDGEAWKLPIRTEATYLQLSLYARGEGAFHAELLFDDATFADLTEETISLRTDVADVFASGMSTVRQTQQRDVTLIPATDFPFLPNGWSVRIRAEGGPLVVHGMLRDEEGFASSSFWLNGTEDSTLAWPATADRCIAVGAVPAHTRDEGIWYHGEEAAGEVRAYSARGPRIDGDIRPHVVAPDNPWTADTAFGRGGAHGGYRVFGGTSGAGPHVAGLAALLLETGVTASTVFDQITASARPTGEVPNNDYGFGEIHVAAALGGAQDGDSPAISLAFDPPRVAAGETARLVLVAPDETEARWDDGYDGVWDTDFAPSASREWATEELGALRVKVRVRDGEGRYAEAAALLVVEAAPEPVDAGVPDAGPSDIGVDAAQEFGLDAPNESSGCGCATTPPRAPSPWWALGFAWLVWRRTRRPASGG